MTYPYNPRTSPKMRMSTIVTNTLDSKTYARTHYRSASEPKHHGYMLQVLTESPT